MSYLTSSQEFIRALKASSDPPNSDAPSKIEIASNAWNLSTFYVPNKDQVIADWILTRFLKEKNKDEELNPVVDLEHWLLLASIVDRVHSNEESRRIKTWLVPLLNRTPFAPVVVAYLRLVPSLTSERREALVIPFLRCFGFIWPLTTQKVNAEVLLECFGTYLDTILSVSEHASDRFLTELGPLITTSYRNSLSNSTSKKKLYASFTAAHLGNWLQCILHDTLSRAPVVAEVYTAGVETLFSIDILRQISEDTSDVNFFTCLSGTGAALVALPRLFSSFCECIRRAKGALFGSKNDTSTAGALDQLRVVGMRFYASCDNLLSSGEENAWSVRAALLNIVERENLFSAANHEHLALLKKVSKSSVTMLKSPRDTTTTESVYGTLCALTNTDYGIVEEDLADVLPLAAKTSCSVPSAKKLLNFFLEYHNKTRTIPSFLLTILTSAEEKLEISSAQEAYDDVSRGSILELGFLDRLAKSVHSFVTPGQCLDLLNDTSWVLQRMWSSFQDAHEKSKADLGDGARKKRKLDGGSASDERLVSEEETIAVRLAFVFRLVSVVWPSIPLHSVPDDTKKMLRDSVASAEVLILSILKGLKKFGGKSERRGLNTWSWEVIIAAVMRLQYALTSSKALAFKIVRDEKAEARMLKALGSDKTLPELKIEIVRFFLYQAWLNQLANFEPVFDLVLIHLECVPPGSSASWNGLTFDFTDAQRKNDQIAIALLRILVDRWLSVIEENATSDQLGRFVKFLLRAGTSRNTGADGLSLDAIYRFSLRSAEFWELPALRNAVLSHLSEETAVLGGFDLRQSIQALQSSSKAPKLNGVEQLLSSYETLLYTPLDYLSKNARTDLLKRGLVADVLLTRLLTLKRVDDPQKIQRMRIVIREVLNRMFKHLGVAEYAELHDMTEYLVDPRWSDESSSGPTLSLLEMHYLSIVKSAEKGQDEGLLRIVTRLLELDAFGGSSSPYGQAVTIRFLEVVTKSATIFEAPVPVLETLQSLASSLGKVLNKRLSVITSVQSPFDSGLAVNLTATETWCRLLALKKLLKFQDDVPEFGINVARKILVQQSLGPLQGSLVGPCKTAILLLQAELRAFTSTRREKRLEVTVAMYVLLYSTCGNLDLDSYAVPVWDSLSSEDFAYVLDFILESMASSSDSQQEIAPLVHLATALLHDTPEGTMKICQRFTSSCFSLFLDGLTFLKGSVNSRTAVLRFVSSACSNRPASSNSVDVMYIWSLLSRLLVGSETHEETTSTTTLHDIIAIISSLIRLRRDLVLPTLPHLGMVLRQLMMTVRIVRSQLGGKQSKMVKDTFPSWINPAQPLSVEDAKAIARLLGTLTTKTIVRVYGSNPEVQKAESLARPFGKHASYVLVAYIEAMNDPLCVISAEIRRELMPGLFALCDMLNDHDREALMLSALDGGGKTTMKGLWKEYEKQKYVGKG